MNHKAWLWTAAAQLFTVFWINLTRAATAIESVLGKDYQGVVSADRYGGYNSFKQRQVCWAHVKRDFHALVDGGGDGAAIGERLLAQLRQVFDHWHDYRAGKITRRSLAARICCRVQNDLWETLDDGMQSTRAAPPSVPTCSTAGTNCGCSSPTPVFSPQMIAPNKCCATP